MKKVVSLVATLCFLLSNISFAGDIPLNNFSGSAINLAVPSLLHNILYDSEISNEPMNIKFWFMGCLKDLRAEGFDFSKATPVEIRDRLKKFGDSENAEIFHPDETQFFVHEAKVKDDGVHLIVRIKRDNSIRTYTIDFSGPESIEVKLREDSKESIPSDGIFKNMNTLKKFLEGIVEFDVKQQKVSLIEDKEEAFIERLPVLVYNLSVNPEVSIRNAIEWIILELGPQLPVNKAVSASGQELYRKMGRKYYKKSALLKINQRALIPYLYRIMLKVMREQNAVMMSQVAISEAIYIVGDDAKKSPAINMAQAILAGAVDGRPTPIYNSRDHLQVNRKAYDKDPIAALRRMADTIRDDVLNAKIYNIDLDTSTLALTDEELSALKKKGPIIYKLNYLLDTGDIDLEYYKLPGDIMEQQRPNFETAVKFIIFGRLLEQIYHTPGIAFNGEVGEVGTENVTREELKAYLVGYKQALGIFKNFTSEEKLKWIEKNNSIFGFTDEEMEKVKKVVEDKEMDDFDGLEAMSCQVGSAHGGVKVPGKPWKRTGEPVVDMDRLEELADICREFGLAGLILHGASSLSEDELQKAVKRGAIAVHLATYIHDRIFGHPKFPTKLILKLFTLIRERNKKLYDSAIDKYTPDVKMSDIIAGIEETIKKEKPLSEEQREQVAWLVHQARGKGITAEQHDKGEGLWSFIDLEKDMLDLPKETLEELNKAVEEQILRYVELLNAKDTGDLVKDAEFPTPPSAPMPEPFKDDISESGPLSKDTVFQAGLEIPTHLKTRYTLLLASEFYADREFERHKADFKERFNLGKVSGRTGEEFVKNVLKKAVNPDRTVVLVPDTLSSKELTTLTEKGIRVVRTNIQALIDAKVNRDANRGQFQLDTYATMILIRRIKDISKDSTIYFTLRHYIKDNFKFDDDIALKEYIQAVIDGTVDTLIKGYLSYRPAVPHEMPRKGTVTATLFSA